MTRLEIIRNREYWVEALECKDYNGTTNIEFADNIVKMMEEAINYSRCSLQLKDEETPTFEEWLKSNKYSCIEAKYINDKGRVKGREFLWRKYTEEQNPLIV